MLGFLNKTEKTLGKARETRRYDLPLNQSGGAGFLTLLVGLMTFLAVLAAAAAFTLGGVAAHWSSGLKNSLTIEIPLETVGGALATAEEMKRDTASIVALLESNPVVASHHVMSNEEIGKLVEPWLGKQDFSSGKFPLPGMISVTLKESVESVAAKALREKITAAVPRAQTDGHESWLAGIMRFTGILQFAALSLVIVIGVTTATAVAGAVRARMAVNHAEVELLHLMGASDTYIATQFQRHSLILALKGSMGGMLAGVAAILLIGLLSSNAHTELVPGLHIAPWQFFVIGMIPALAAFIAALTTRHTVFGALRQMP